MKGFYSLFKKALLVNGITPILSKSYPQRGLKFSANIKWKPPEKKPVYHPEACGDLELVHLPPKSTIRLDFQNSEVLKNASDAVKKIFSLEYLPPKYSYQVYEKEIIDRVKRNECDVDSLEVKIARCTAKIRFNQPFLLNPDLGHKKKAKTIIFIKELIDKRRAFLRVLRMYDYKRFEWVLDQLNIVYKPEVTKDKKITRKRSLTLLAKLQVEENKEKKLAELRKSLDEQKIPFLKKKIEKLRWIKEMELKNNLPPSVADEEINECLEKIEKVKLEIAERVKRGYQRKIHPYFLEAYDEKLLEEKEQGSS